MVPRHVDVKGNRKAAPVFCSFFAAVAVFCLNAIRHPQPMPLAAFLLSPRHLSTQFYHNQLVLASITPTRPKIIHSSIVHHTYIHPPRLPLKNKVDSIST